MGDKCRRGRRFGTSVFYAVNCAEKFAAGAMKTLSSFGAPLTVAFGSESGNVNDISALSEKIHNESEHEKSLIKQNLKSGMSLIRARAAALDENDFLHPTTRLRSNTSTQ